MSGIKEGRRKQRWVIRFSKHHIHSNVCALLSDVMMMSSSQHDIKVSSQNSCSPYSVTVILNMPLRASFKASFCTCKKYLYLKNLARRSTHLILLVKLTRMFNVLRWRERCLIPRTLTSLQISISSDFLM